MNCYYQQPVSAYGYFGLDKNLFIKKYLPLYKGDEERQAFGIGEIMYLNAADCYGLSYRDDAYRKKYAPHFLLVYGYDTARGGVSSTSRCISTVRGIANAASLFAI